MARECEIKSRALGVALFNTLKPLDESSFTRTASSTTTSSEVGAAAASPLARDPRALAIVGHLFMLLTKVGRSFQDWWLQQTIEDEFKILMSMLRRNGGQKWSGRSAYSKEEKRGAIFQIRRKKRYRTTSDVIWWHAVVGDQYIGTMLPLKLLKEGNF